MLCAGGGYKEEYSSFNIICLVLSLAAAEKKIAGSKEKPTFSTYFNGICFFIFNF